MRKIVVDTNIVFSAIVNLNAKIGDLLMNSGGILAFYSCNLLQDELLNNEEKLLQISGMKPEELGKSKNLIFNSIEFISEELVPFDIWKTSIPLVREVDMDDIAFVALNEYLEDSILWTGDKKLLTGLHAKGYEQVISTERLFELRERLENE